MLVFDRLNVNPTLDQRGLLYGLGLRGCMGWGLWELEGSTEVGIWGVGDATRRGAQSGRGSATLETTPGGGGSPTQAPHTPPIRPRGRFIKRSTPAANPFRVIHRPLYTWALSTHTTLQSFILKINYRLFSLLACSSHVPRAWACQTDCGTVLVYCWTRIADDDPTISQHWANVLGGVPQSSHTTGECFFNQWQPSLCKIWIGGILTPKKIHT